MKRFFVATLTAAFLVATSAAANVVARTCYDRYTGETYREGGVYEQLTSWYGPGLDGNHTASGAIFNQNNPNILAHKVLPLGTVVSVYNPETHVRSVATILDDGPHAGNRNLDASTALADELGFRAAGEEELIMTVLTIPANAECRDDGKGLR